MWLNAAVGNESETSDLSTSLEEFIAAIQCSVRGADIHISNAYKGSTKKPFFLE